MNDDTLKSFNDKFDLNKLQQEIEIAKSNNSSEQEISLALISPFFNEKYIEFYQNLKKFIRESELSIDEIEELLIANFNRLFMVVNNDVNFKINNTPKGNDGLHFTNESSQIKVKSHSANKDINATDALENSVDALNILFSYLRREPRIKIDTPLDDEKTLNAFFQLDLHANQYAAYKSCYDNLVWQRHYITQSAESIRIVPTNREYQEIIQIGKTRMEQTISGVHLETMVSLSKEIPKKLFFEKIFRAKRKEMHLYAISTKDGYIRPRIKKGYSQQHLGIDLAIHSQIIPYYEYAENLVLPTTETLEIKDITIMYAELIELVTMAQNIPFNRKGGLTIDKLYAFPFRINNHDLVNYFRNKTHYSNQEITSFIHILSHSTESEERINFWKKPLVRRGNDLLFPIMPITRSHLLYLIDEWLRAGGYSLQQRGPIFEKYLKNSIERRMARKGYSCKITSTSFKLNKKDPKPEQVDIVAEFSDCILIAEAKCIGYPIEPMDWFNCHNIITKAAGQINRKVDYITKNKEQFSEKIPGLLTKPIIKAVIVNYPLFSGTIIDGVPVTEISFLENYISKGGIDDGLISIDRNGKDTTNTTRINFYENEKEFCENFSKYLANPIIIEKLKGCCEWEELEVFPGLFTTTAKVNLHNLVPTDNPD